MYNRPEIYDNQAEMFVELATQLYHIITTDVPPDAESEFVQNLKQAITNGFDVDFSIKERFRSFSLLQIAITEGLGKCALPIINAGANVDIRYPNGNTTLLRCITDSQRIDLLEAILQKTKNIDRNVTARPIDEGGYDAATYCVLMYAATGKNHYLEMFKKIIDAGANFNFENCTRFLEKELGELNDKQQALFNEAIHYIIMKRQILNEFRLNGEESAYDYEL